MHLDNIWVATKLNQIECTSNLDHSVISFLFDLRSLCSGSKKKLTPFQRQDPLCLSGRAQLPGHGVQVQGGGRHQRDAGQLLLPTREFRSLDFVLLCSTTG